MNIVKFYRKIFIQIITVILCIFMFTSNTIAHSGRTDSKGGHYNRKTGGYHYHNSGKRSSSSSSSYTYTPKPSISIKQAPSELNVGDSSGLEFSVDNASGISVKVESSDPEVVRVNNDNTLTAIKEGSTTITISASDASKSFTISVKSVPVEDIILNETDIDLQLGLSLTVEATVVPENATDNAISWSSDNSDIFEISDTGTVIAKAVGNASITCTANNGMQSVCKINVFEVFPEKINTDIEQIKVECKESISPTLSVEPENANNKNISCKIQDENIATVDKTGTVTGKEDGETKLIITTDNGIIKEILVTVYHIPVENIDIDTSNIGYKYKSFSDNIINHKDQLNLTASAAPHNATYSSIEWESSNAKIVDIVEGNPVIVGTGNVTLTALAHEGVSESITFKVVNENVINGSIIFSIIIIVAIPSGIIVYKKRKKHKNI